MQKTTETTLKRWIAQAVGMSETIEESPSKDNRVEAAARLRLHLEGMAARLEELE